MPSRKKGMHLQQVLLEVKDVERSKQFYTKTLGFKLLYDFSPEYLAVGTPNKLQIGFYPAKSGRAPPASKGRPAAMEFEVDSVDTWYNRLKKKGVRFVQKPKNEWGEREARFLDPDGFRLAISGPIPKRLA